MIAFEVNDMTCGHCVGTITRALKAADSDASVEIDLATRQVRVEPATAGADVLAGAIRQAGYSPVAVNASPSPTTPAARGCCCG